MKNRTLWIVNLSRWVVMVSILISALVMVPAGSALADSSGPTIDVWYGTDQYFGDPGVPARQIYILGNVSDSDGVASLEYSLNGSDFLPLSIGPYPAAPNGPRLLYKPGDFAVELFDGQLKEGANTLVIRAKDRLNNQSQETVRVHYKHGEQWPLPITTTWTSNSSDWQRRAQVLTGKWTFEANSVSTAEVGYDRMIAIGDLGWRDYEVKVDITIRGIDSNGFSAPSYGPGVGLLLRWTGHTDDPYSDVGRYCEQPKCGYLPYGGIGWLRWMNSEDIKLQLLLNNVTSFSQGFSLGTLPQTLTYKMRVETLADGRPQYSIKVWEQGAPEPSSWTATAIGEVGDPISGSVVLLAHHVDAKFGNVEVTPLPLSLPASTARSDDFNVCALNTARWTLINPRGDGTQDIQGAYSGNSALRFVLPRGVEHDMNAISEWGGNQTVRVVQPINDTDFTFEVKFDSSVQSASGIIRPLQGIMVEEAADPATRWIRADFYSQGNGHGDTVTRLYVATYEGEYNRDKIVWFDAPVFTDHPAPLYLRMQRVGSRWIISVKSDASDWQTVVNAVFLVQAARVGLYGGNAYGVNSPAFTALFDYFENKANPISGEDAARNMFTVNINPPGGGNVTRVPDETNYACGTSVAVAATANPGYTFAGWSGDLSGTTTPGILTMDGPKTVTATFSPISYKVFIPLVLR